MFNVENLLRSSSRQEHARGLKMSQLSFGQYPELAGKDDVEVLKSVALTDQYRAGKHDYLADVNPGREVVCGDLWSLRTA